MKKILLITIFIFTSSFAYSQFKADYYLAVGYNYNSNFGDPLDYIVDRYNETRTSILSKQMNKASNFTGMSFSMGGYFSNILFDIEYVYKYSSTMSAEAPSGGITQKRELKVFGKSLNLGFNYVLGKNNFYAMPGFSLDFNFMPVESRIYNINNTEPPAYEVISESGGGSFSNSVFMISPNVHLDYLMNKNLCISFKPYYSFSIGELDYSQLNQTLNPNTYQNDPASETSSKIGYFGAVLKFKFLFSN